MIDANDLRCPCSNKSKLDGCEGGYICSDTTCVHHQIDYRFGCIEGTLQPVLVSELLCDTAVDSKNISSYVERPSGRYNRLKRILRPPNKKSLKNASRFYSEVIAGEKPAKILIIGGGICGAGVEIFSEKSDTNITVFDVYSTESTDLIADAHYLPFASETFDGVWIQAVLEHVVEPQIVVAEIHRVLKLNGLVYSEVPFLQQVHEGPYDFTRFTVVGHRFLFAHFTAVEFGPLDSPLHVLNWNIKYLVWSLTRSIFLARVFAFAFFWIAKPLEFLIPKKFYFDNCSGVFFLGRKSSHRVVQHRQVRDMYLGAIK